MQKEEEEINGDDTIESGNIFAEEEEEKTVVIDINSSTGTVETPNPTLKVGFLLIVACISSVSMIILNKKIVINFNFLLFSLQFKILAPLSSRCFSNFLIVKFYH
jgi:hypothetical protein